MFQRFSPLAIKSIMLAQQNVHDSKRIEVQPADLFVGVCSLEEGTFLTILKKQGLSSFACDLATETAASLGV